MNVLDPATKSDVHLATMDLNAKINIVIVLVVLTILLNTALLFVLVGRT